jgi:hypothetical protein
MAVHPLIDHDAPMTPKKPRTNNDWQFVCANSEGVRWQKVIGPKSNLNAPGRFGR